MKTRWQVVIGFIVEVKELLAENFT